MKNKNKIRYLLFAPATCLLLAMACTGEDALTRDDDAGDGHAIRFTATIGDFTGDDTPATRAGNDGTGSFANGDETIILTNTTDKPNLTGHSAIYDDGTWTSGMSWDDFDNGAKVNFYVFFPKMTVDELAPNAFDLPANQSTIGYAAADLLHAAATGQNQSAAPVALSFRHVMHRLVVKLGLSATPGTLTQGAVNDATVVIKDMRTRGSVSNDGTVSSLDTSTGNIIPRKSATGNTFYAILLPQPVTAGTPWIEVRVGTKAIY